MVGNGPPASELGISQKDLMKKSSGPKRAVQAVGNFINRMKPADVSNRRDFLKTSGKVAAGAAALYLGLGKDSAKAQTADTGAQAIAKGETKEGLKPAAPVLMIDFDPKIPDSEFAKKFLGEKYAGETSLFLDGVSHFCSSDKSHGQLTSESLQKVLKDNGYSSTIEMKPIQEAFDPRSLKVVRNEDGTKEVSFAIDSAQIAEMIKGSNQDIVNISFQVGEENIKYNADNTVAEVNSAYSEKSAGKNLPRLYELCKAFPDKLFITASGNFQDRGRSDQLKPDNLIIVSQWDTDHPKYGSAGDLYVDNNQMGVPDDGSSFSTVTISAYASILRQKGWSISEVKQGLLESIDSKTIMDGKVDLEIPAAVFNPSKIPSEPPSPEDLSNSGVNILSQEETDKRNKLAQE